MKNSVQKVDTFFRGSLISVTRWEALRGGGGGNRQALGRLIRFLPTPTRGTWILIPLACRPAARGAASPLRTEQYMYTVLYSITGLCCTVSTYRTFTTGPASWTRGPRLPLPPLPRRTVPRPPPLLARRRPSGEKIPSTLPARSFPRDWHRDVGCAACAGPRGGAARVPGASRCQAAAVACRCPRQMTPTRGRLYVCTTGRAGE